MPGLDQGVAVEADADDLLAAEVAGEPAERGRVLVDDRDRVAARLRGSWRGSTPTRPQPMITTCTGGTLHGARRPGWPYACRVPSLGDLSKRLFVGRPLRSAQLGETLAAQAARAAGLRQRRAVVRRLRDRGDPARPLPRRAVASSTTPGTPPPASRSSCSSSSRRTGRTSTPTRAAAATTRSRRPTSGRAPG